MAPINPLISVVIPFYNRVALTVQAVESVFSQTYQHFEIILVNDGSTEPLDQLERIIDKRLHLLSQSNHGPASARNAGIRATRGDYIAFLDSDDLFLPEKLERQIEFHLEKPEIGFSHTNYFLVDREGEMIEEVVTSGFSGKVIPRLYYDCRIAMPTVMIKKTYLSDSNLFLEKFHISEDIIFYSRVIGNREIIGLDEALTKVRLLETNKNRSPTAQIIGARNILNYLNDQNVLRGGEERFVRSRLLANIALNHLALRNFTDYFRNAVRAFFLAPMRTRLFIRSWRILQPGEYFKKRLK